MLILNFREQGFFGRKDDSTIFAASIAETISFVKKAFKAKRSCKQEGLMNMKFRYKGRRREVGFRYDGRDRTFLVIFLALGILFFGVVVATAGGTLSGRGLLEAILDFVKS